MKKKHRKTGFVPDSAYRKNPYIKHTIKKNIITEFVQKMNMLMSFFLKNSIYKIKHAYEVNKETQRQKRIFKQELIAVRRNEEKRIRFEKQAIEQEIRIKRETELEEKKIEKAKIYAENKAVEIAKKTIKDNSETVKKEKPEKIFKYNPHFLRMQKNVQKVSKINFNEIGEIMAAFFLSIIKIIKKPLIAIPTVVIVILAVILINFSDNGNMVQGNLNNREIENKQIENEMKLKTAFETDPIKSKEMISFYSMLTKDTELDDMGASIPLIYEEYKIVEGDNATFISQKTGASIDTIISVNKLTNAHLIRPGKTLKIPNRDGLLYEIKKADDIEEISERYEVPLSRILKVNEVQDAGAITNGHEIFLPGAKYTLEEKIKMYGLSFFTPLVEYRLTSMYGYRNDPFNKTRANHKGIDLAAPTGTPVRAARGGSVSFAGYSEGYGLLIILTHPGGYSTYYGHLSKIHVKEGQKISMGQHIGNVGATGRVTGPHLHFEIRNNGAPVNPARLVQLNKK